jgi:DNA-binding NtrC family response regulator
MDSFRIMIVDDEQGYRDEIREGLEECGFKARAYDNPLQALSSLKAYNPDLAIVDLRLPQMTGLELMRQIHEHDPDIGVIMISGHGDMDSVIAALREGAIDFFTKPFNLADIRFAILRSSRYLALQECLKETKENLRDIISRVNQQSSKPLIGSSPAIMQIVRLMGQVSPNRNTDVLITGESGTGKELVARGIHSLGAGADKVFFDVNCTAIPETLFESEFFGYANGAFTGAHTAKKGWFELANGGTLFLDEIGDLPLAMQAKLLRVLEERRIRHLGSNKDIHLNLRVIASTNKDIKDMVSKKLFREDLYYRLNRFSIHLPALRDHASDIPELTSYFLEHFFQTMKKRPRPISAKAMELLATYDFPGNIRELKNCIEKAIILLLDPESEIKHNHFPDLSHTRNEPETEVLCLDLNRLEQMESAMICQALRNTQNNKSQAAELLKITRSSLNRKIKKHNLDF